MTKKRDVAGRTAIAVRVGDDAWSEVDALADAGPEDKVFALDSDGHVVFGDGTHGRRPAEAAMVTVSFVQGGGSAGNVGLSVTTPWPPRGARYQVALAPDRIGVGASDAAGATEHFDGGKRPRYFAGQLLGAGDFAAEQQYLMEKRFLHNRVLHGAGVATGLSVSVDSDPSAPAVVVEPGVALDPQGRELELRAPVRVEVGSATGPTFLVIEHTERETDPVLLPGAASPMATRIEDGVSLRLSDQEAVDAGVTLARLLPDTGGWMTDSGFAPQRCR